MFVAAALTVKIGFNVYSPEPIVCLKVAPTAATTLRRCAVAFILDMSSGKEYPGEELACPNQRTEKTPRPDAARDDNYPPLQLTTVEATASVKQQTSAFPGFAIDSLIKSIKD